MLSIFARRGEIGSATPIPVHAVLSKGLERFLAERDAGAARWLKSVGFGAKDGELVLVPNSEGGIACAVLGLGSGRDPHAVALCSERLPAGLYMFGHIADGFAGPRGAYAWAIGSYAFDRYRSRKKAARADGPRLVLTDDIDGDEVSRIAEGVFLARDLINTPSNDMGPAELEQAARAVAGSFGARIDVIEGDALLKANYPMVHAVGRASVRAPRLIDFTWGNDTHPKVTLVGKGVCFDTGGLDLKNASGMATMKKDMGGAACVLGLAQMIMDAKLPVRLRVMIPAVENSVSGCAVTPSPASTTPIAY